MNIESMNIVPRDSIVVRDTLQAIFFTGKEIRDQGMTTAAVNHYVKYNRQCLDSLDYQAVARFENSPRIKAAFFR